LPDQELVCDKIAGQHGYEIIDRFRDATIRGDNHWSGPGFQALMRAAKERKFEAVIIESLWHPAILKIARACSSDWI